MMRTPPLSTIPCGVSSGMERNGSLKWFSPDLTQCTIDAKASYPYPTTRLSAEYKLMSIKYPLIGFYGTS